MTDDELINALATTAAPLDFEDIEPWRAFRDRMQPLMAALDVRLKSADEAELAALQARVAALQLRTGVKPPLHSAGSAPEYPLPAPTKPRREIDADGIVAPPSYAETDAGQGRGGGRERPQTLEAFNLDLSHLRDRTTEKRSRNGLA